MPTTANQRRTARELEAKLLRLGDAWGTHMFGQPVRRRPSRTAERNTEAKEAASRLLGDLADATGEQAEELRTSLRYVADCADQTANVEEEGLADHFEGMATAIRDSLWLPNS